MEVLGEEPGQVVVVVARGEETVCRGEAVATDDDEKRKERKKTKKNHCKNVLPIFGCVIALQLALHLSNTSSFSSLVLFCGV